MTDTNIKIAFDIFDADGTGKILCDQFYSVITGCNKKVIEKTKNVVEKCDADHI